jgi:atypical dual specificity phosphatase
MDSVPVDNFSWLIEGELAGSGLPRDEAALAWLADQGIRAIVSLTEVAPTALATSDLERLHLPIVDLSVPLTEQIDRAVDFIDRQRADRRPVLVHCAAGYGRTGTILACYLVATGLAADAAIARVRDLRPGSLETDTQAAVVRDYARRRSSP